MDLGFERKGDSTLRQKPDVIMPRMGEDGNARAMIYDDRAR